MNKAIPDQAPPAYEEAKLFNIPHRSTAFHSLSIPLFTMAQLRCQNFHALNELEQRLRERSKQIDTLLLTIADNKYLTEQLVTEKTFCKTKVEHKVRMRFGMAFGLPYQVGEDFE